MARKLIKKDFTDVHVLKGGWTEWIRAQYPKEEKKTPDTENEAEKINPPSSSE